VGKYTTNTQQDVKEKTHICIDTVGEKQQKRKKTRNECFQLTKPPKK